MPRGRSITEEKCDAPQLVFCIGTVSIRVLYTNVRGNMDTDLAAGVIERSPRLRPVLWIGFGLVAFLCVGAWTGLPPFRTDDAVVTIPAHNSEQALELFRRDGYRVESCSPASPDVFGDRLVLLLRRRTHVFAAHHSAAALTGRALAAETIGADAMPPLDSGDYDWGKAARAHDLAAGATQDNDK